MNNAFVTRIAALAETNPAVQDAIDDLVLDMHVNMASALGSEGPDTQLLFLRSVMSDAEILEAINLEI